MKTYIIPVILIGALLLASCKPKCCSDPLGFSLEIKYVTKGKKELLFVSKDESYRYDTRKIEVYKVIPNDPDPTKKLLVSNQRKTDAEKEVGDNSLNFYLPIEDTRVNQLLIYLYPSSDIDTITYTGVGDYNIPYPKDVFYNTVNIEKLVTNWNYTRDDSGRASGKYQITVTKPD